MIKNFVAVRTAYYKNNSLKKRIKTSHQYQSKKSSGDVKTTVNSEFTEKTYKSALAEFDHVLRLGKTNSVNVHDEFSHHNVTVAPANCDSPLDAYYKCRDKYKEINGRSCRKDMNSLFEHVVIFSEERVLELEKTLGRDKATKAIVTCLKNYSKQYAEKYGFTSLGFSYHGFDEGHYDDDGKFVRNVHAHIMFFNYDFKNKKSNLKFLMNKGKDPKTGKTNELNENFVAIQDLAYESFKVLKFNRGKSKLLTLAKYLPKHQFLKNKISNKKSELKKLLKDINQHRTKFENQFSLWLQNIRHKFLREEHEQALNESITNVSDQKVKSVMKKSVEETKEKLNNKNNKLRN
ncbi:hypothetical protein [Colwellia sp. MB3u-55]|jgi:hypothetical protein|uniref:hypothetical protein n=1 Tax=Colwellia sp. MB3u-55 TaxID=2759810 RepID=UPI0015F409A3|nr:hypothetical protein [Colwellia sp. MB3u-55]MBA6250986.1 hypothetical protein [Colwellia sp. MB3u-55]